MEDTQRPEKDILRFRRESIITKIENWDIENLDKNDIRILLSAISTTPFNDLKSKLQSLMDSFINGRIAEGDKRKIQNITNNGFMGPEMAKELREALEYIK